MRDGVFDASRSPVSSGPMPDGTTAKITANNQTSCLGCHNLPHGNPGGGPNFAKDSGRGRNSPHYYGGGHRRDARASRCAPTCSTSSTPTTTAGSAPPRSQRRREPPRAHGPGGQLDRLRRPAPVERSDGQAPRSTTSSASGTWTRTATWCPAPRRSTASDHVRLRLRHDRLGLGQGPGRAALNPTNRAFLWDPFK